MRVILYTILSVFIQPGTMPRLPNLENITGAIVVIRHKDGYIPRTFCRPLPCKRQHGHVVCRFLRDYEG